VINPGFESETPVIGPPPTEFGIWRGDVHDFVSAENGINPMSGSRMLRFINAGWNGPDPALNTSEVYQNINITGIPNIENREASLSAWFNRVPGDFETDTRFCSDIFAYDASNNEIGRVTGCVDTDGDVSTWEQASATMLIPPGTTRLLVRVAAAENVFNDGSDPEFDGHYADDVVLFIPIDEGEFWYYVVGRSSLRGGFDTEYYLHYGNAGNATIDKAAILLTSTNNATMSHSVPLAWSVSETYEESPSDSVLILTYNLTPGTSGTIPFYLKAWSGSEVTLGSAAWVVPPMYSDSSQVPESPAVSQASPRRPNTIVESSSCPPGYVCPDAAFPDGSIVFQSFLGMGHMGIMWHDKDNLIDGGVYVWESLAGGTRLTSWEDFCWRTYEDTPMGWQDYHSPPLTGPELTELRNTLWATRQNGTPLPWILGVYMCPDAVHDVFEHATGRNLIDGHIHTLWDFPAYDWWRLEGELWPVWPENVFLIPRIINDARVNMLLEAGTALARIPELIVEVVNSWDPNEKTGLTGYGPQRFVRGDQELPYLVYFENHPDSASTSARLVSIADTLDVSKYDIRSVSLGQIVVGEYSIAPPSDARNWTGVLDLPDTINVGISIDVDTIAGILTWQFETLDSLTGLPPDDPIVGFLPINTNPPEGEGHVEFSVLAWDTLLTGTTIENRASIVFDYNEPILTPVWTNIIDNSPPQSHVCALDSVENTSRFDVKWEGIDDGAGGLVFSVYVSDDGGSFEPWIVESADTVAWFDGQPGHDYAFYSAAKDGAGNVEPLPVTSDEKTTVSATATGVQITTPAICKLYNNFPNPFNPVTTIRYDLPRQVMVNLNIYDVRGRLVYTLVHSERQEPGTYNVTWDGRNNSGMHVATGVYFYRLIAGEFVQAKKMVLLK
jgi:hypothetical protein